MALFMAFPATLIYGCWARKKQDKIKKDLETGNQGCFRSLKSLYPRTIHLLSFFQVNTSGEECLLKLDNPKWNDVNMVTSQLKLFFRKLPDPIFTTEMYNISILLRQWICFTFLGWKWGQGACRKTTWAGTSTCSRCSTWNCPTEAKIHLREYWLRGW